MASFLLGVHYEQPELENDYCDTQPRQPLSLQLYSEYRSTYKWHEFSSPGAASASQKTNNATTAVVKQPPKPVSGTYIV